MQDTKYIQFSFLQKFYRYSFLERGADSGMGGRWEVKHEKGRGKGDLESWWEKSKNTDLERVESTIGCRVKRKVQKVKTRKVGSWRAKLCS